MATPEPITIKKSIGAREEYAPESKQAAEKKFVSVSIRIFDIACFIFSVISERFVIVLARVKRSQVP
jgi:hypothetical protein